jgi:hypothetical protein
MNQLLLAPGTTAPPWRRSAGRQVPRQSRSPLTIAAPGNEELTRRGAVFVSEPRSMGSGGIDAVFEDGCGNLLNLHRD